MIVFVTGSCSPRPPHPPIVICPQAKESMLFAGSAVASGAGSGIVTATGMATEIGKIQSDIQAASEQEMDTPLKQKLDEFGGQLANVRGLGAWGGAWGRGCRSWMMVARW